MFSDLLNRMNSPLPVKTFTFGEKHTEKRRKRRWRKYFKRGTRGTKGDSRECVFSAKEERNRKKSSRSKTTALTSAGGSSYITEGARHAWLLSANRDTPVVSPNSPSHRDNCRPKRSSTLEHVRAVCLLALLFQRGQLCDSRRWHLCGGDTFRRGHDKLSGSCFAYPSTQLHPRGAGWLGETPATQVNSCK